MIVAQFLLSPPSTLALESYPVGRSSTHLVGQVRAVASSEEPVRLACDSCVTVVMDNDEMSESWASSPRTRSSMRGNRRRDTLPEMKVRRIVHKAGLRYRVDFPPLSEYRRMRADLVFTRLKIAVFVDGCFWHGCAEHYKRSKTNVDYWEEKIRSNQARDKRTDQLLEKEGWMVLRFWAHEDPYEVAECVIRQVLGRRKSMGHLGEVVRK